ncbi:MAG: hypothetical protein HYZ17_02145 [Betaproteobacteria bacterium]|nr:hypothetical protein [Betaproteobacteria bacterium]
MLSSPKASEAPAAKPVAYVVVPQITTNSSSPSPFTWPPTKFSVHLACEVMDANGALVVKPSVVGEGRAEFSEFKRDFSLSGKRAAEDALLRMGEALSGLAELRAP